MLLSAAGRGLNGMVAALVSANRAPENQWPRELLDRALTETAKIQQNEAAQRGHVLPLADIKARITLNWLDAMYPAGNA